jgi:hypothetical protein
VPDGWLVVSYPKKENNVLGTFSLCDNDMSNFRQVYEWNDDPTGAMDFNAMRDICRFGIDRRGGRVFFYTPGRYRIQALDIRTGEITMLIDKPFSGLPFDAAWAKSEFSQNTPRRPGEPGHRLHVPEKFPAIARMRINPHGQLLVTRGNRPELMQPRRVDMDGGDQRDYPVTHEEASLLAVLRDRLYYAETDDDGQLVFRIEPRSPLRSHHGSSSVAEKE